MMTKWFFITLGIGWIVSPAMAAQDEPLLARVTVYWRGEGQMRACTGARLSTGHCAVDPRRIPYGSTVVFPDAACLAVDTGSAVVSRQAARRAGRNARERSALVIDRFFETKGEAMAWARSHPPFMTVHVLDRRALGSTQVAALSALVSNRSRGNTPPLTASTTAQSPTSVAPAAPWVRATRRHT